MKSLALFLAAIVAVALAESGYYVPRAYYTIDAEGHASAPVPLHRLKRSLAPYPYGYGGGSSANANANANAQAHSGGGWGEANANANANAEAHSSGRLYGSGGWRLPVGLYGSANPNALSTGQIKNQSGPVIGARSISASSSVGLDGTGNGYYDQTASVA